MLRFGTVVAAASVLAAAFVLPAHAKDGAANATAAVAASSPTTVARAELATPKVKRVRNTSTQQMRRVAAVAAPVSYHPQCFLFFCTAGGRHYNFLMLGIGF
jgi:hypothetical protein